MIPEAEHAADAALAARLIAEQFPELGGLPLVSSGQGWDNVAFEVGGEWLFRFPRRALGAGCLLAELQALPHIAPNVPLAVPVPRFVGRPAPGFPAPFAGYRRLPGVTACCAALEPDARRALARPLGEFLRALHALDTAPLLAAGVGLDTLERTGVERQAAKAERYLVPLLEGPWADSARLGRRALQRALGELPPDSSQVGAAQRTLVHGDLYGRHLLVDEGGRLSGVIDWGDVHIGDAALDLALASSFLPPAAHDELRAAYGGPDEACWARARFRAVHHSAVLLAAGAASADVALARLSAQALAWLAAP